MTEQQRTLEQVEQDVAATTAAQEKLRAEQEEISRKLNDSTDGDSLLAAALSGRSLAGSQKVGKLQARAEEITEMLRVLDARMLRLKRERTLLKQEELQDQQAVLSEEHDKVKARFDEAQAALNEAQNQLYYCQQAGSSLRDELNILESKLWQVDEGFRREQEEDAQRRREAVLAEQAEQAAAIRRTMAAASGLYIDLDTEQLENLHREAERQGSKITVFGPKNRGDE
jgi:chromosome segregation ATPase